MILQVEEEETAQGYYQRVDPRKHEYLGEEGQVVGCCRVHVVRDLSLEDGLECGYHSYLAHGSNHEHV